MSKGLVLLSAALLALPQAAALAEDGSEQYAPCVGPMCLLTPVWKFGTMLPDLTAKPKQSIPLQNVQPVSTNPINTSPAVAPNTAPAKSAEAGKPADSDASNAGQGDTGERDAGKKKLASLVRHSSYRFAYHFDAQHTRSSTRPASPTRPDNANATVTVAANETEIGRMLRLASVVTTPPIKVIPAPSYGCPERPADFVVDTMSNPRRVGPAIPLFTESLIIVARGDVKDLAGLRGRLVSFGLADSSSQQVADRTFRSLAIDVREQPLDLDNALDALALGDLDAIALLAPKGFERLAHHDPNFHLLALPDRFRPPDGLKLSGIDPSSYLGGAWSTPSLSVVTVDAVLSPSQAAQMPPNAQAVYAALDRRSSELAANGFDLIGGNGGLTTMRSSAKDVVPGSLEQKGMESGC